uniref:Myosin regulatory light chain n=1 Tax=Aurelia sp. 2017-HT TaxID=2136148 RepID=A0A2Z5WH80_9CNID|nr:myosin regulatory light chain [Aurelia sp. 2017-HT]
MSSKKGKKGGNAKKRAQRATSNVFAMFDQSQIQEFKEAFNMIDQNRDGFIDKADLQDMYASLGKEPKEDYIDGMIKEATGPINFTMFLTLYGEKLNGTDPEDVIRNAFGCFDEEGSGVIYETRLKELMMTMGDRFSEDEVDDMLRGAPIDGKGNFNYVEFTRILKHGTKEE